MARRGDLGREEARLSGVTELDVVTGAFSYTGRHIAEELLGRGRSVRTLTRRLHPTDPLASRMETAPLAFDDSLVESLSGADTLYNTYWVRFERGRPPSPRPGEHRRPARRRRARGVRRVVHVSVANPASDSPYPYFRGKAQAEELVRRSGISHAIVRPTLVFGAEDILINNIAWILRRAPLFLVPGDGRTRCSRSRSRTRPACASMPGCRTRTRRSMQRGPSAGRSRASPADRGRGRRARARIHTTCPARPRWLAALRTARARRRADARRAGEPDGGAARLRRAARGDDRFDDWLVANAATLGRSYQSELGRNFRGQS